MPVHTARLKFNCHLGGGLRLLGVVTISPDGLEAWKHPIEMNASMIVVEYDRTELLEQAGAAVQESY